MNAQLIPSWAAKLVADGNLTEQQLESIQAAAKRQGTPLERALISSGLVLDEVVAAHQALDQGVPFVDPRAYDICFENSALIPEELARKHLLFPLFSLGDVITLGMANPSNLAVIDQIRLRTSRQVEVALCPASSMEALIDRAYRSPEELLEPTDSGFDSAVPESDRSSRNSSKNARLVHSILEEAVRNGASDIHIEPDRDRLRVRIRVDGLLHETTTLPLSQHAPMVSRIKVLAQLDIAETRRPQDGHYSSQVSQGEVDVRVSTIPTVHGENVVLRILLSSGQTIGLGELGMPKVALEQMRLFLDQPNGMILVTGPTGSGKTTTLYAALARLNSIERNLVTVEDPVEKRLPLIRQTEVNPKAGVTFSSGLRSILRQDPDVIMIGEIRDQETADIAIQSALTGHLVLSTLHTNSAAGAIVRLNEMGIAPFLITSSLRGVISQRLVRRVCASCKKQVTPDVGMLIGLGLDPAEKITFWKGEGCTQCLKTGYRGRVGIYELLQITSGLRKTLLSGASRGAIEDEAQQALACSLHEGGLDKVREGLTTLEEVARIVGLQHPGAAVARGF